MEYFHIEHHSTGHWRRFTENPLFGKEAAEKHLADVQAQVAASGGDPARLRLSEPLDEKAMIEHLTAEEKMTLLTEYVGKMGVATFFERLREMRQAKQSPFEKYLDEQPATGR